MKVFISSVVSGFEEFRDAAGSAIRSLGYAALRAEDFHASPSSPKQACLEGVRGADLTILLLGGRYGAKQASGLSATHEEYREARQHRRVQAFVQEGVEREPDQAALVHEVRQWETGHLTVDFTTEDELQSAVTLALHRQAVSAATSPIDEQELLAQAKGVLSASTTSQLGPQLTLSLAMGPSQQILRPSVLEDREFARRLQHQILFGPHELFAIEAGTQTNLRGGWLVLSQEMESVGINSAGNIVIHQSAVTQRNHYELQALIEEDIEEKLVSALVFAAAVLDQIDSAKRLSHVVAVAALTRLGHAPWRTRAEHARSPSSGTLRTGGDSAIAYLTPSIRPRVEIGQRSRDLAQDLMVLLRRQLAKSGWANDVSTSFDYFQHR